MEVIEERDLGGGKPSALAMGLKPKRDGELIEDDEKLQMRLTKEVEEYYEFTKRQLTPLYQNITRYWKLYLRASKDQRKPWEKWRALVPVPYPFSTVETTVAAVQELLYQNGSPIQPESVGTAEEEVAEKLGRYWDYIIRKRNFPKETDLMLREMLVQGFTVRKNVFTREERQIFVSPDDGMSKQFEEEVELAIALVGEAPPMPDQFEDINTFHDVFESWREIANNAGAKVPEFPRVGPQKTLAYLGPEMLRVAFADFFFDPSNRIEKQPVIQRSVVPVKWIMERTGSGEDKAFDPKMVELALQGGAGDERKLNEWSQELAGIFGISFSEGDNPHERKMAEVLEYYDPDSKHPYRIVLNRKRVINKLKSIPWEHGQHPYTALTNIELPWTSAGMSELYQGEPLFKELNTLRGLRIDAVTLATLPVFARMREAGMTDIVKRFAPGLILDSSRGPEGIGQISNVNVPGDVFRETFDIKEDLDTTNATSSIARGSLSIPSRTTATTTERAAQRAMTRQLQRIFRLEGDLSRFVDQSMSNMNQFLKPGEKLRVGGKDGVDPFLQFTKQDFLMALNMEYAFRGARTALDKELNVQQKKDLLTVFINAQLQEFKPDVLAKSIHQQLDPNWKESWKTKEELEAELEAQAQAEAASANQPPAEPGAEGGEAQGQQPEMAPPAPAAPPVQ